MKNATAIRHVAFEDLGSFEHVLLERGIKIDYLNPGRDNLADQIEGRPTDLLVILGGPVGVYEADEYPFLKEELRILQARLSRKEPTLGICLGAQLIAAALGARIYPAAEKEIGWAGLELSPAGSASPLTELRTPVLHWHGDTFDLPAGAVQLASTPACKNQAFALEKHVLGLQFHAEVLGTSIEAWLIGHACEIANTPTACVKDIRADTLRFAGRLEVQSRQMFGRWLDGILVDST